MQQVNIELIEQSEAVSLYSIKFLGEGLTEFEKFLQEFRKNAEFNKDYQRILYAIGKILDNGALERYFRPEGKYNDGVCAVPLESGMLRLYCLRMSDQILIVGNGGIKQTGRYQDDPLLNGYVITLQNFEKLIRDGINNGLIAIQEKELIGVENKTFNL